MLKGIFQRFIFVGLDLNVDTNNVKICSCLYGFYKSLVILYCLCGHQMFNHLVEESRMLID